MRASIVLVLMLSAAVSGWVEAQGPVVPDSAMRIRVSTVNHRTIGQLVRLSHDSVLLTTGPRTPPLGWSRDTVVRIEVSRGRRGHFWLGLGAGMVAGLVAGKLLADATDDKISAGVVGIGVWAGSAVVGGVAGALIRTERWAPARWPPVDDSVR